MSTRLRQLGRMWKQFSRSLDFVLPLFFLLSMCVLIGIALLAFQRTGLVLVDIDLGAGVRADYSVESIPDQLLPPLDLGIISEAQQDAEIAVLVEATVPPIPGSTPTATPQPTSTPGVVPFVRINAPDSGDEGADLVIAAEVPPALAASFDFFWDLDNDGEYDDLTGGTITYRFNDEGNYPILVRAVDDAGNEFTDEATIDILNVPPSAFIEAEAVADEGSPVSFRGSAIDPGLDDTLFFEWDFGDGSPAVTGHHNPQHAYADDGTYQVTLSVFDNDGGVGQSTFIAQINDVLPLVDLGPDQVVDEGTALALSAVVSEDPGDDVQTYAWDFDYDGFTFDVNATGLAVTRVFGDGDAFYTVGFRTLDEENHQAITPLRVTVNNVTPSILDTLKSAPEYQEGNELALEVVASDPGDADTLTYAFDWNNDGNYEQQVTREPGTSNVLTAHIPPDNDDNLPVRVRVTDKDQAFDEAVVFFNVRNVSPTILEPTDTVSATEGVAITLTADAFDPAGQNDPLTYLWFFEDTQDTATGLTVQHVYADDGVYNPTLTVRDDDGGQSVMAVEVNVGNTPPSLVSFEVTPPDVIDEGQFLTLNATANDVAADALTYQWDLSYAGHQENNLTLTGESITDVPVPDGPDVLDVTLVVSDGDGGTDSDSVSINVNNLLPQIDPISVPGSAQEAETVTLSGTASDVAADNDTLTYRWFYQRGNDIVDIGFEPSVDFAWGQGPNWPDAPEAYDITFEVKDKDGGVSTAVANIVVNNAPPVAVINPASLDVDEGLTQTLALDASGSNDPLPEDNSALTYRWELDGDGQFNDGNGQTAFFPLAILDGCDNCTYPVELEVNDNRNPSSTGRAVVMIQVNNLPPVADAGGPYTITKTQVLTLSGAGTVDPGPDPLDYTWVLTDSGLITKTGETITYTGWITPGIYSLTLRVDDDDGAFSVVTTTIDVTNPRPVAVIGGPYSGSEGVPLALDGSGSFDPQGDSLISYAWDLDDDGLFDDASGATISFTYLDDQVNHPIALRVTDTWGASDIDTTIVNIQNLPPTIESTGGPYGPVQTNQLTTLT
ncbi:MAG: PKD domain-containing protein, partial [Anaerolineae bacterium]